ncbi:MAG: dipeptidase [Anaerolineae bacterium]|nr:dipeptidase [Anaerolineae bacterium]
MNPYEFVKAHHDEFLNDLITLLRIPSVSTMTEHKPDIRRAAEWLRDHFEQIGMSRAEIIEAKGNPLVYAEWLGAGQDAPTVLIYGHYDVQPADDENKQWRSDPFEPVIRDGHLYARGATDDKGQTFVQMKAVHALLQAGQMPINVKFIVEGEEEAGSDEIHHYVRANTGKLACDVIVVSDTHMIGLNQPSIVTGLRGITYLEVEVWGPDHDLHSGTFGGIVHNPAQALVEILAQLHHADGSIAVPGFYDAVRELSPAERSALGQVPYTAEQLKAEAGVDIPWGEPGYEMHERLGIRPTLEINGIVGGWTGEGAKTVLPARALAKVSCRLVPDQDPKQIEQLIREFVASLTPPTVRSEVRSLHDGNWAVVETDSPFMQAAVKAYAFGFGAEPVFAREGGSIPVVGTFQNALNVPVVLMGFGLPDDNLHGPNEKFTLECFAKGMQTAIKFFEELGAQ